MAEERDLSGVDMHAMFEAKMGFLAEDVPLSEEQLEKFLLLCQQAYLEDEAADVAADAAENAKQEGEGYIESMGED